MDKLSDTCANIDTVGSFCDCIAEVGTADPAEKSFCNRAKKDKNITDEDLADMKMALTDQEDEGCCEC